MSVRNISNIKAEKGTSCMFSSNFDIIIVKPPRISNHKIRSLRERVNKPF